jgi:hypothetical protein
MALKTSEVYRCLEKKTVIFGFEVTDVFLIFLVFAVFNFILGAMPYRFFVTWGLAGALAITIRLGKAGKPDGYLIHLLRFQFQPDHLPVFPLAPRRARFKRKDKK